jgi:heptosyltransferase-2
MTTPALLRLREAYPAARITLLTHAKLADLWPGHPALNGIMAFDKSESLWAISRRLRAEHFDLAVILPNSPRSAIEAWLAGIPKRVGLARPWRNTFLTQAVPPRAGHVDMRKRPVAEIKRLIANGAATHEPPLPASAHHLHQYLHIVATVGGKAEPLPPCLAVSEGEVAAMRDRIGTVHRPLVGLVAGAEYGPAKRWPVDRFVAAARELQSRANCAFVLLGGKGDAEITGTLAATLPGAVNLAGATTLRELCAALKACRVVIANDTGPMHVAAAVGTPVVGIFGSTSPELTGPGLPGASQPALLRSTAPCAPCFLRECPVDFRCMREITTEQVIAAALKALADGSC